MTERPPLKRIYPDEIGLSPPLIAWDARQPFRAWGRYRTLTVNTPASVGRSFLRGPALSFTGNTTAGLIFGGQDAIAHQQWTAIVVATWRSGANNFPQLCGTSTNNNGFRLGASVGAGGDIGIVKGGVAVLPVMSLTSGAPTVIVASHDAVTGAYYIHARRIDSGAIVSNSGSNTSAATASTSGNAAIGISRTDFAGAWNGDVAMVIMAHEFLPETQALQVLRDPWALWREPRRRTYFIPAAAAPGGFQAAWAQNSNHVIGIAA